MQGGSNPAEPAADLWALGALAHLLLTGRPLFAPEHFGDEDVVETLLGWVGVCCVRGGGGGVERWGAFHEDVLEALLGWIHIRIGVVVVVVCFLEGAWWRHCWLGLRAYVEW